jgi:hypothetical protein
MLRFGYGLMLIAGLLLGGYVAYILVRFIVEAPGLGLFFKVVILIGAAGFLTTLAGLILERRKERADDPRDD